MRTVVRRTQVIVIGGGPAGMSAALACVDLRLSCTLIERESELGGQLLWTYNPVRNYPGVTASNGRALAEIFERQLAKSGIRIVKGSTIVSVDVTRKSVQTANGQDLTGDSLIFATGVRRRKLGVPGEDEFIGRGILTSGAKDKKLVAGKRVVIVGGGDAAIENALILSEYARSAVVLHRRDEFRARNEFLGKARKLPNVQLSEDARIVRINGGENLTSVTASVRGEERVIECDYLLIRIGVEPNTELFSQYTAEKTADNIAMISPGVIAIGDVTDPLAPTISNAVGAGSSAAKWVARWLDQANSEPDSPR